MLGNRPLTPSSPLNIVAYLGLIVLSVATMCGCSLFPDVRHKPQYSNPFPQLTRIAIIPFYNQSDEPTLDGREVATAYYNELQSIPGFEVLPVGVIENALKAFGKEPQTGSEFQEFARFVGADAVLVGAVTDYDAYYPPRLTMRVNWYSANPAFHPIPAGYGLPWGTKEEKNIPSWIKLEAERELAKKQLETQTPEWYEPAEEVQPEPVKTETETPEQLAADLQLIQELMTEEADTPTDPYTEASKPPVPPVALPEPIETEPLETANEESSPAVASADVPATESGLPANWPDPQGFIPAGPAASRPRGAAQYEPIISHMRAYNGHDEDITRRLEEYYYFRDDARRSGWQSYLKRSEDFIRFCCHMHLTETLSARGGELESRMIFRWPIGRYQR